MRGAVRTAYVLVVAVVVLAGCGRSPVPDPSAPSATGGGTVTTARARPADGPSPGATPTGAPVTATPGTDSSGDRFISQVRPLTDAERAAMTGVTWRDGCPVGLDDLRHLTLTYRDFEGRTRQGALVVHADIAGRTVTVFEQLYQQDYPIRRMEPIEAYGGSDFDSIEADNTSAFNCRLATNSDTWSNHAYGRAIDVNPLENPYILRGRTVHTASEPYLDRGDVRPGMLVEGSPAVAAFDAQGFSWGGRWASPVDTQHFEIAPG